MDGHRHIDSMTHGPLDSEIESMLAVEPSPEFVARVRVRVAREPEPKGWRAWWLWAVPGVAAMVMAAVIAWPSRELPSPFPRGAAPPAPQQSRPVETIAGRAAAASPPVRRRLATASAVARADTPDRAIEIDLPEVVIADNEARTFAALVASARQSPFEVAVPAAPDPDTPLEITELPTVEPLEIEPIVKLAALQAEGERP
jgi:hypothetical protein